MSKLDLMRDMNTAIENKKKEENTQQLEGTMEIPTDIWVRLEKTKLEQNEKIIMLSNLLSAELKEASMSVHRSAQEVRAYPVEVISQTRARMEEILMKCESAAEKARTSFEEIVRHYYETGKFYFYTSIAVAVLSPAIIAFLVILKFR